MNTNIIITVIIWDSEDIEKMSIIDVKIGNYDQNQSRPFENCLIEISLCCQV